LPAAPAQHGQPLQRGRIYVAVPDHHQLAYDHGVWLSTGPTENRHRPAVDALFRSVALGLRPVRDRGGALLRWMTVLDWPPFAATAV
jgi:two-component system chemotaxis response regulator CheB